MFKILVLEDDRDLNRSLCAFLNRSGYEAVGVLNANDSINSESAEKRLNTERDVSYEQVCCPRCRLRC